MSPAKFNVLICDLIEPPAELEQKIFGQKFDVVAAQAMNNGELKDEYLANCDGIIAYDKITYHKDLQAKLKKCKVIVRAGIGTDNIDLAEAKRRGIKVCNVPDYCKGEVADHAIALLLSLVRGIPQHVEQIHQGQWVKLTPMAVRLYGKTFGILGMGRIGRETAVRAQALGMKIVFYDPFFKKTVEGCKKVKSLEELARLSDVVSVHSPLTPQTKHALGEKFFKNAKKGMFLINSARGPVIDMKALRTAMKEGIVAGCGVDALPPEFDEDQRELMLEFEKNEEWLRGRFIATPHAAFYSKESFIELRSKAAAEVKRVLEGKKPLNWINKS